MEIRVKNNLSLGIYVPGNYKVERLAFNPVSMIYSNKNCSVFVGYAQDEELMKRCRNGMVAVKIMRVLSTQQHVDAFYQEISLMNFFVGKPNIVQLVGFSAAPYQILTDYYALGSLEHVILKKKEIVACKQLMLRFCLQISGAIRLMHENGFAHADIKAMNVFIDRDGRGALQCYLGDFGLTRVLEDTHLVVKSYQLLNLKGLTIPYAAPEVLRSFRAREAGGWNFLKADIYSLGILLFEIINWKPIWKKEGRN